MTRHRTSLAIALLAFIQLSGCVSPNDWMGVGALNYRDPTQVQAMKTLAAHGIEFDASEGSLVYQIIVHARDGTRAKAVLREANISLNTHVAVYPDGVVTFPR